MAYTNPIVFVANGNIRTQVDTAPGGVKQSDTAGRYPGQLGQIIELSEARAQAIDSSLHAGRYQYVVMKTSATAPVVGAAAVWSDQDSFEVTSDTTAANIGNRAGFFLNTTLTSTKYGWIQLDGSVRVLFGTLTKVAVAGDLVLLTDATGVGKADVLADATNLTSPKVKAKIGVAQDAPASDTVSLVQVHAGFIN